MQRVRMSMDVRANRMEQGHSASRKCDQKIALDQLAVRVQVAITSEEGVLNRHTLLPALDQPVFGTALQVLPQLFLILFRGAGKSRFFDWYETRHHQAVKMSPLAAWWI